MLCDYILELHVHIMDSYNSTDHARWNGLDNGSISQSIAKSIACTYLEIVVCLYKPTNNIK